MGIKTLIFSSVASWSYTSEEIFMLNIKLGVALSIPHSCVFPLKADDHCIL